MSETLEELLATLQKPKPPPDVLSCLQGIKCVQQNLRERKPWAALPEAVRYAAELPEKHIKRLTELTGVDFPALIAGKHGDDMAAQLASDAAFSEIIRAANSYRAQLGYKPLGPNGWPEKEVPTGAEAEEALEARDRGEGTGEEAAPGAGHPPPEQGPAQPQEVRPGSEDGLGGS